LDLAGRLLEKMRFAYKESFGEIIASVVNIRDHVEFPVTCHWLWF
jgi:hypothetical protein